MMSDWLADMLTRIRNAQMAGKKTTRFPNAKFKRAVLDVLRDEGYIGGYEVSADGREIELRIKYYANRPVIERIVRVSRPGLRRYVSAKKTPLVRNGLGIAVISTSQGVMSDHQARAKGVGGELLCEVY
jgi:small subunit ribosomal protein S8